MKAWMGYSRSIGCQEWAMLIFAYSWKQARQLMWSSSTGTDIVDGDYLDIGIRQIKDRPWIMKYAEKEAPHVSDNIPSCKSCELWGDTDLNEEDLCEGCASEKRINQMSLTKAVDRVIADELNGLF